MSYAEAHTGLASAFRRSSSACACLVSRPAVNLQVDVYAFAMIAYELFEGKKPFGNINPIEAARRASMDRVRPEWGKWGNQCVPITP